MPLLHTSAFPSVPCSQPAPIYRGKSIPVSVPPTSSCFHTQRYFISVFSINTAYICNFDCLRYLLCKRSQAAQGESVPLFLQRGVADPIPTAFHPHSLAVVHSVSSSPIDSRRCWQSQSVLQPQRRRRRFEHHFELHYQPLPCKVYHTSAGLAEEPLPSLAERNNIGIEENAQHGHKEMGPVQRAVVYQGHNKVQDSSRRTQKS